MRKIKLIILCVIALNVFLSEGAFGAKANYKCIIEQVGVSAYGEVRVILTEIDEAFTWKVFKCPQNRGKEMLAILLTAAANDMMVRISTDLEASSEPEILVLFTIP